MRVPFTPEMREMSKKLEPYLVRTGLERRTLVEDAPDEIRKMYDEYLELFEKRYREAGNDFNPETPLPEDE